jgi:hypothetical protein
MGRAPIWVGRDPRVLPDIGHLAPDANDQMPIRWGGAGPNIGLDSLGAQPGHCAAPRAVRRGLVTRQTSLNRPPSIVLRTAHHEGLGAPREPALIIAPSNRLRAPHQRGLPHPRICLLEVGVADGEQMRRIACRGADGPVASHGQARQEACPCARLDEHGPTKGPACQGAYGVLGGGALDLLSSSIHSVHRPAIIGRY